MAVPIILGAVAAGSAAYGAYKGIKGAIDKSDANDINESARSMVDDANEALEKRRETTNAELADYGARKLRTFNEQIPEFIATFERLKNVEWTGSVELDKLNQGDFSTTFMSELKSGYEMLQASGMGLASGLGGGAALAFGAYNGTMLLATASTGTAIGTLSGAAATNATLAWLGGGSLAAGGFGMAGGMMVLGGLVIGPALGVFGHFVGNAGEEALNNARANLEQAETLAAHSSSMELKLSLIHFVVKMVNEAFATTSKKLRRSVDVLKNLIDTQGEDFSTFDQEDKKTVFRSVKFAQLIKAMIDTPILDKDGNLVLSTSKACAIGHVVARNADADKVLEILAVADDDDLDGFYDDDDLDGFYDDDDLDGFYDDEE